MIFAVMPLLGWFRLLEDSIILFAHVAITHTDVMCVLVYTPIKDCISSCERADARIDECNGLFLSQFFFSSLLYLWLCSKRLAQHSRFEEDAAGVVRKKSETATKDQR